MPKRYIKAHEQRAIIQRAQEYCEYCLSPMKYTPQSFVFEHIKPMSLGGKTKLNNLALACGGCNGHKYNRVEAPDPVDGKPAALFNPRRQIWREHFAWSKDYTHIFGLTPIGRATVETLKLNRPGVVNLRKLLLATSEHPPEL